jgi:hypothetical protein
MGWLGDNAVIAAEEINRHTLADLRAAIAEADDPIAAARDVFDQAAGGRADMLGLSRATTVINWSRGEAGRQSVEADGRPRTKTWVVTSSRSRHPQWNGDTVPVGDLFSNGGDYPGDYVLGVADAAGCHCLMELA